MNIDVTQWIAPGTISVIVSVGTFFFARTRDAEERGALKQRVTDLERRQDVTDAKMDKILEKLDAISASLTALLGEHRAIAGACSVSKYRINDLMEE